MGHTRSLAIIMCVVLIAATAGIAAAQCSLQEDFTAALVNQWIPLGTGTVTLVNGALHLETSGIPSDLVRVLSWDCQYQDLRISVDLRDLDSTRKKSVAFRTRGTDLFGYHVELRSAPWNDVLLVKGIFGEDHPTTLVQAPYPHSTGVWQHLDIYVIGSSMRVDVNGVMSIQYNDPSPAAFGDVFLGVNAGAVGTGIAEFDNLVIEAYQAVPDGQGSWGSVKALYTE